MNKPKVVKLSPEMQTIALFGRACKMLEKYGKCQEPGCVNGHAWVGCTVRHESMRTEPCNSHMAQCTHCFGTNLEPEVFEFLHLEPFRTTQ